jgi:lysozyme
VKAPLADHEAAAVLSWGYNVGVSAACTSTLVAKINAGAPAKEWCVELKRWVYAGGKKLRGLERRREAEYTMCIGEPNAI